MITEELIKLADLALVRIFLEPPPIFSSMRLSPALRKKNLPATEQITKFVSRLDRWLGNSNLLSYLFKELLIITISLTY